MKIAKLISYPILNCQGHWTLKTKVVLDDGSCGEASVPFGISSGTHEAVSLEVDKACQIVKDVVFKNLVNFEFEDLKELDRELLFLDGTENKSRLGGNTTLSISVATLKAISAKNKTPLYNLIRQIAGLDPNGSFQIPKMLVLMFEGGKHGSGDLKMQEFMQIFEDFEAAAQASARLEEILVKEGLGTGVGREGAFSPSISDDQALGYMVKSAKKEIALDVALMHQGEGEGEFLENLIEKYPISLVEDPFGEDDYGGWAKFNKKYGQTVLVVGDDLVVTNVKRLKEALRENLVGGVIVKPNQIGTVTETLEFVRLAKESGLKTVVSHRGEDTNDDFVADLAVGIDSDYVKFGAMRRGERVAKYNRLIEIQRELNV